MDFYIHFCDTTVQQEIFKDIKFCFHGFLASLKISIPQNVMIVHGYAMTVHDSLSDPRNLIHEMYQRVMTSTIQ